MASLWICTCTAVSSGILRDGCKLSICLKFIKYSVHGCGCLFCGGDDVPGGSNSGNNKINGSGTGTMESKKKC